MPELFSVYPWSNKWFFSSLMFIPSCNKANNPTFPSAKDFPVSIAHCSIFKPLGIKTSMFPVNQPYLRVIINDHIERLRWVSTRSNDELNVFSMGDFFMFWFKYLCMNHDALQSPIFGYLWGYPILCISKPWRYPIPEFILFHQTMVWMRYCGLVLHISSEILSFKWRL